MANTLRMENVWDALQVAPLAMMQQPVLPVQKDSLCNQTKLVLKIVLLDNLVMLQHINA